ncbi:MAG: MFS transporter [Candidatus Hodarchaeales archaeon]
MVEFNSFKGINRTVILLGLVSLFTDISSEMIVPLIPLFLGVLGVEFAIIGLIEGIAEGTANIVKGISGFISDKVDKKRKLLVSGYGLSSISKPIIAFATSWQLVLFARFGDRIGKGIRTSPRDHLLSISIEEEYQGKAFGFHRAMDTTGAIIGAFIALFVLVVFASHPDVFRIAFLVSFLPAIIAVGIIFLIKEESDKSIKEKTSNNTSRTYGFIEILFRLPREFRIFLLVVISFAFVQVSVAFFILRSQEIFDLFNPSWWPITGSLKGATFALFGFLVFNIVYALFATSLGSLSDKIGRIPVIVAGTLLLGLNLLFFSLIPTLGIPELVLLGMMIYGLYIASTEGILKAFVADFTKGELVNFRGTTYGWFNLTLGLTVLVSSFLFGLSWDILGSTETFFMYSLLTVLPVSGFLLLIKMISK